MTEASAHRRPGWLRTALDALYFASGVAGALFLVAILTLIVLQMLARWTGEIFPGAPEYVGYCMAAASFLAFGYALNSGSHIRVSILLNHLSAPHRRLVETWCLLVASAVGVYLCYFAVRSVYWSWKFKDVSGGPDAALLWIPQSAMVVGSVVLAIALLDNLVCLLATGRHRIQATGLDQHAE